MNEPNFSISIDQPQKMIRIVMRGFWDEATMFAYDKQVQIAGSQLIAAGCSLQDIRALVDARSLGAQAQELVAAYKNRFVTADRQPGRIATLVGSSLFKRQVERIAVPNQRIFEDERDAMAWLLSES